MADTSQQPRETPIPSLKGDATPASPAELTKLDWKQSIKRGIKEFKDDRATLISGGMAFYWFLAVFPAVIAAVGVLGLVHAGPDVVRDIQKAISTTLPGDAADVLVRAVASASTQSGGSSLIAAVIGVVLALSSASAGMVALQKGMDVAYDVPVERKLVAARLRALVLIAMTAVLGGVATALIVFGQPLGNAIGDHLPLGTGGLFVLVWTVLRWVLGLAALSVLFACFYTYGPNRDSPKFVWVSPGGVLATVVWLLASLAFSFYVSAVGSNSYFKTYGSLTGVVVLMLWLYLSAIAVMAGAEINAELERQGHRRRTRERRRRGRGSGGKEARARYRAPEPQHTNGPLPNSPDGATESDAVPDPVPAQAPSSAQDAWFSYGTNWPDD